MRFLIFSLLFVAPMLVGAQATVHNDVLTLQGEVVSASTPEVLSIAGTGAVTETQTISVQVIDGELAGEVYTFTNDLVMLEVGEQIFFNRMVIFDGDEFFVVKDVDRRAELYALGLFFIVLLVWFAGKQGLRAILSLGASVVAILFILVPALLAGYNPVFTSLGVAAIVLAVVLFGTHGFRPHSFIAFGGTLAAVIVTCAIAAYWVSAMRLSGFGSDASVYLNFATDGQLDFAGLLLGAIIIGILGVLDDVSITQASVVQELKTANKDLNFFELYKRAIRVGRDHVGSLVNTLALAYVGVSLPLVLFMAGSEAPVTHILNQEIVAAELVRIIIGSIGLVLAVPFTTLLAAWWFDRHGVDESALSSHGHHHHH